MEKYTYVVLNEGLISKIIQRSDGASIPEDPANSDYQAYLKWLENPNAPTTFPHQPLVEG
jgi:hypothetical protein